MILLYQLIIPNILKCDYLKGGLRLTERTGQATIQF